MKIKNDRYRKNRGKSTIYSIYCTKCSKHLFNYQKDGIGSLKRFYADRMDRGYGGEKVICPNCQTLIANYSIYKPENRPAFVIKPGAIRKTTD